MALIALFGAFALVYGAMFLAAGLNLVAHKRTDWVPYVVGGLAGIAIGAVTFFRLGVTALVLIYFIAAWAIVTGLFEIVAGVGMHGEIQGDWLPASPVWSPSSSAPWSPSVPAMARWPSCG